MAQLDYKILYRRRNESHSTDFFIDGKSLLQAILEKSDGHSDYLGCFARNWDSLNNHSKRQLLKLETPETESGRSLIYVCPECADIGCGAFGCKITKKDGIYIWSDFAYENGYEDPKLIQGIGPFDFKEKEYENVIEEAFVL